MAAGSRKAASAFLKLILQFIKIKVSVWLVKTRVYEMCLSLLR